MPNLKFLAFTVPEILGGPKIPKVGHVTLLDPFWPNFGLFSLVLTAVHLCAKFEVSSFKRSRDIRGVPKIQNWVTWPPHDPFWPNFAFFRYYSLPSIYVPNLKFLALFIPEILGGSQKSKIGSRDPHVTPTWPLLTQFCIFFVSTHCNPSRCQIWSF